MLVNNAAVHYDTWQRAPRPPTSAVVREALETNVLGAWRLGLALLPLLRAQRGTARMVNVSSERRLARRR